MIYMSFVPYPCFGGIVAHVLLCYSFEICEGVSFALFGLRFLFVVLCCDLVAMWGCLYGL